MGKTFQRKGMRRGEVFNLKWVDVDFGIRVIYLRETKSEDDREIPMNEEVYRILKVIKTLICLRVQVVLMSVYSSLLPNRICINSIKLVKFALNKSNIVI